MPLSSVNRWCSWSGLFLSQLLLSSGYFEKSGCVLSSALISVWSSSLAITSLKRLSDWILLRLLRTMRSSLNSRVWSGRWDVSSIFSWEILVSIIDTNMAKSFCSLIISPSALSITRTISPSMLDISAKIDSSVLIGSCLTYSRSREWMNLEGFSERMTWLRLRMKISQIEMFRALKYIEPPLRSPRS